MGTLYKNENDPPPPQGYYLPGIDEHAPHSTMCHDPHEILQLKCEAPINKTSQQHSPSEPENKDEKSCNYPDERITKRSRIVSSAQKCCSDDFSGELRITNKYNVTLHNISKPPSWHFQLDSGDMYYYRDKVFQP